MIQKEKFEKRNFLVLKRELKEFGVQFIRLETELKEDNALLFCKRFLCEDKFAIIENTNIDFGFYLDENSCTRIIGREKLIINCSEIFEVSYNTHEIRI